MEKHYDLIVAGGGFAGVCGALEAARHGRKVLLIERNNALGGAAVNCLVLPFMNYWTTDPETDEKKYLTGDIFREITGELTALGGLHENEKTFDEEILKLVLQRMCLRYGVHLLLDTVITDVETENGEIRNIRCWGKSKAMTLSADFYLDATGDAELSCMAGCRHRVGRQEDGLCQPMTLSFRLGGVDHERFLENKPRINPLYRQFQEEGKIKNPRENVLSFRTLRDDVLHFNTTRVVRKDPTDPEAVTCAELEAREQVFEMLAFLKENIPGFEKAYVLATGLQIGIRESRMVEGEYTLTVEDLKGLARFPDAVAVANYDIDIHNPEGAGTSHYYFQPGQWYQIPYRCLLPKECHNLLVAGRCISSTHEAQASYRIMPFCAELGQAAGAAATLALQQGTSLRQVDITVLQAMLRKEGYVI